MVNAEEVDMVLMAVSWTTCVLDSCLFSLLKALRKVRYKWVQAVVNASLQMGVVPLVLKQIVGTGFKAAISPLKKKWDSILLL